MRFSFTLVLSAFVASISAQNTDGSNPFNIPAGGYLLNAGQPTTFTWQPTTPGTVTLTLRDGANGDLNPGTVIQSNIPNDGSYTYTPPATTVEGNSYTIQITSDSDSDSVNFTPQFVILSPVKAVPSSASTSGSVSSASDLASTTAETTDSTLSTVTVTSSADSSATSATVATVTTTGTSGTVTTTGTVTSTGTASSSSGSTTSGSVASSSTTSRSSQSSTGSAAASAQSTAASSTNGGAQLKFGGGLLAVVAGVAVVVL